MSTYSKPGRGAWRLEGGLLPAKPASTSKSGYYRASLAAEKPVGSGWIDGSDTSHDAQAVFLGVKAIQGLVGAEVDGWFGPLSAKSVTDAQKRVGIEADGIVGRATMRALLTPLVEHTSATFAVPVFLLGGLLVIESSLDPGAVGVNGADHGVAQINLDAHEATVSLEQAMDPQFSTAWTAQELHAIWVKWTAKTAIDPWTIAVANHNSPLLAKRWAITDQAPFVKDRAFQIADYVTKVRTAW
jgi:hypothetical protein